MLSAASQERVQPFMKKGLTPKPYNSLARLIKRGHRVRMMFSFFMCEEIPITSNAPRGSHCGGSRFCRFGIRSSGKIRYWNEVRVNSSATVEKR